MSRASTLGRNVRYPQR